MGTNTLENEVTPEGKRDLENKRQSLVQDDPLRDDDDDSYA
jgi:hypothetical protein